MEFLPKVQHFFANTWGRVADVNAVDWQECSGSTNGMLQVQITNSNFCDQLCPILPDVQLNLVIKQKCEEDCRADFWSSSNSYQGTDRPTVLTVDVADGREPVTQVHEFGHALGFAHEFERPDWPTRPGCSRDDECVNGKVGSVCIDGGCECRSDNECAGGNWGGTCESGKCSNSSTDMSYATTKADEDSVLAATYFNNATNGNTDGIADPMRSLSPFDVIGVQKIYGPKADGAIVGLDGKCVRAEAGSRLKYWDCQDDGDDVFPSQFEPFGRNVPESTDAAQAYRRLQTVAGSGQCWTTSGTRITSSECESPLADTQEFQVINAQLKAMGNMCVVASSAEEGATLQLDKCGAQPDLERWDWWGNALQLTGSTLCLTVPNNYSRGSRPTLQTCVFNREGALNQGMWPLWAKQSFRWLGKKIAYGSYSFNVLGGQPAVGAKIALWNTTGDNTKFYFSGKIRAYSNKKCLDLPHSVTANGTVPNLYTCGATGQPNQEWDYHF
jgi:hypothetical protein